MSRSGYSEDCENLGLWRGAVERAIRGKRGQAFLREMAAALDAMPRKELGADEVARDSEHVCAMGSVVLARRRDVTAVDVYDADDTANLLGIAGALAKEIAYENDECGQRIETEGPTRFPGGLVWRRETLAERWTRMRAWVDSQICKPPAAQTGGKDG